MGKPLRLQCMRGKILQVFSCLQENTVVQTCVVSCYSLSFAGGFGCYLLSMDSQTYENLGPIAGNRQQVTPLNKRSGCLRAPVELSPSASLRHKCSLEQIM